jgi:hypothetical protein
MTRKAPNGIRYLIEPDLLGNNGWLAVREGLLPPGADTEAAKGHIARRFAAMQVWFADLDDFDTRSPAKGIAMRAVGVGHWNLSYMRWAVRTLLLFARFGRKRGEVLSWKLYYDSFLKRDAGKDWLKEEAFRFIDGFLTPARVEGLLYPAVREFYDSFGAQKYLVTRNLERIAYRYSKVLPYAGYFHEVRSKGALVKAFLKAHPEVRSCGSGGDSTEDESAADMLEFYHKKGEIEKPLCLFRAQRPGAFNGSFNLFVGKNRSGLAGILKAYG